MENLNIKCLVHTNLNICFFNKSYNEKGSSLLCHKCILDRQDQLKKYQDKVLYERVNSRRLNLITTLEKYLEELQQLIKNLVSNYDLIEKEIKINLDNLEMRNELQQFKEKLKQEEWDDKQKHDELTQIYFDGLKKGQLEYKRQLIQYQKIIQDQQLQNKIKELQFNLQSHTQEFQQCQIIKEIKKPGYQDYQIKQILYQKTQSDQLHQLLAQNQLQPRYFLFLQKHLRQ